VCDLGGLRSRGAPRAGRRTAESRFATVRARVCVARGDRAAGLGGFGRPPPPPPPRGAGVGGWGRPPPPPPRR
jgi:hypothetical protein